MKQEENQFGSDQTGRTLRTGRPRYSDLVFADDEVDEQEEIEKPKCPYGIRDTSGALRVVQVSTDDPVQETIETAGKEYRVRQLDRHLVFRDLYTSPAGDMLFLPDITPADFAATLQRRKPGRCILHLESHSYYEYGIPYYLCFDTDGTGFALHANPGHDSKQQLRLLEWERVDFRWDDFPGLKKALTAPVDTLRPAFSPLFAERINLQLRMPLLEHEALPRLPATWKTGSEEMLRRLTRAICLTEPDLFSQEPVVVVYRAEQERRRGGLQRIERGNLYDGDRYTGRRAVALCELAFRLNPFTGTDWADRSSSYNNHRQLQRSALRMKVDIGTPTAHETADAFSILQEWLEDKLHDPEKRARFDLPPLSK